MLMENGIVKHLVASILLILIIILAGCENNDNSSNISSTSDIPYDQKINIPGNEIIDIPNLSKVTFDNNIIIIQFNLKLSDNMRNLLDKTDAFKTSNYVSAQLGDINTSDTKVLKEIKFNSSNTNYSFTFHINIDDIDDSLILDNINAFKNNQVNYLYYRITIYDYESKEPISIINTYSK